MRRGDLTAASSGSRVESTIEARSQQCQTDMVLQQTAH
jgi:hypothetical protein